MGGTYDRGQRGGDDVSRHDRTAISPRCTVRTVGAGLGDEQREFVHRTRLHMTEPYDVPAAYGGHMVVPTILGLVAIAAVVLLVVLFVMRSGAAEVTRTEHHLEEPGTPTVTYDLPEGVDPVVVGTELRNAGFTSLPKLEADSQRLVVECGEDDRGRVREVIAEVHRTAYGYDFTADEVVFEEER